MNQPTLRTRRLILRPFAEDDAARLSSLAGERRIADTMVSFPHPYSREQALEHIRAFACEWDERRAAHFAIALGEALDFDGYFAVKAIEQEHAAAEISFWIGAEVAGKGYVTEAGREALRFAFEDLGLNRLCAHCMVRNAGSAKALARLGFRQEGVLREMVRKWGVFEDVVLCAILASEWRLGQAGGAQSGEPGHCGS